MSTPEILAPEAGREVATVAPTRPPLVLTTPGLLKEHLDSYSECWKILVAWIDENLRPDLHYLLIHQKLGPRGNKRDCPNKDDRLSKSCPECHAKAGLLKPGAEKVSKLFFYLLRVVLLYRFKELVCLFNDIWF